MADSRTDASITIGADDKSFQATMANVQKTVQEAMSKVGDHVEGLGGILELVTGKFAAFAAIVGGGAVFGKAIGETTKFTGEVTMLSKQLGISTEDASGLNVALGDIGSDAETYTSALSKLTKQVRTNEPALNAMGIATRDSNGQFLNGRALMDSAVGALRTYKEGTDRNLAAQVAFGKGAQEAAALLKNTIAVQEEGSKKARELGLVLGTENVAAVKAYKLAMNDVGDVLLAIEITIGQAIMPVLTRLANWFSDGGPAAIAIFKPIMAGVADVVGLVADAAVELWDTVKDTFLSIGKVFVDSGVGVQTWGEFVRNVVAVVEVALIGLQNGVVLVFDVIRGAIEVNVAAWTGFANVVRAALSWDWPGVASAWSTGMRNVEKVVDDSAKRIIDKSAAAGQKIADLLAGNVKPKAPAIAAPKTGDRSFVDPNAKKTGRLEDTSKAEYAVAKAQFEAALALQKEYLKEAQAGYDDAYRHNLISIKEYYSDRIATEQAAITLEMEAKRREIEATQRAESTATTDRERLTLKAQEIKLTGELTVLELQRAQVVVTETRAMTEAERQRAAALEEIRIASQVNIGNSEVALERISLDTRRQLRQTSDAQAIDEQRGFEDRITAIQRKAVQDRIAIEQAGNNDPTKIAALNAQIEEIARQHQATLTQLDADATVERQKYATEAANAIQATFTSFLDDLQDRTKKLSDTFKNLFKGIVSDINKIASNKLSDELLGAGTTGGGLLNQFTSKLFGPSTTGAAAGTGGAAVGAAASAPAATGTDAATQALSALAGAAGQTSTGMQTLSTTGIGGMFDSATSWISKNLLGTAAQEAQTTASTTVTGAMAALTTAANAAAAALVRVSMSGGSGGASSAGSGVTDELGDAAGEVGGYGDFLSWFEDIGGSFLAQGTDFVPKDMLAFIHRGEKITPASQNKGSSSGGLTMINHITVPSGTSRASAAQIGSEVGGRSQAALARNS